MSACNMGGDTGRQGNCYHPVAMETLEANTRKKAPNWVYATNEESRLVHCYHGNHPPSVWLRQEGWSVPVCWDMQLFPGKQQIRGKSI